MAKKNHFKQKSEIVMIPRSVSGQREHNSTHNRMDITENQETQSLKEIQLSWGWGEEDIARDKE